MKFWTLDKFLLEVFPEPSWLIDNLIPGSGWGLLVAPGKVGKSTFCYQMADSLAHGEDFLAWTTPRIPRRVAIVGWDSPHQMVQRQWVQLGLRPSPNVMLATPSDDEGVLLDSPAPRGAVQRKLADFKPDFIILDALESLTRQDIQTQVGAQSAVNMLKLMCNGVPFLLIHHTNKRMDKDGEPESDPRLAAAGHHYLTTSPSVALKLDQSGLSILGRLGKPHHQPLGRIASSEETARWTIQAPSPDAPALSGGPFAALESIQVPENLHVPEPRRGGWGQRAPRLR